VVKITTFSPFFKFWSNPQVIDFIHFIFKNLTPYKEYFIDFIILLTK